MREYLVDAIILKSVRARDADRIITLYTKQHGKKRVMAHGVDRAVSKKRGSVQPFSYSKLLLRRGREIDSIDQGEPIEIFQDLRQSLEGLATASYLAELVDNFTSEDDPDPVVFNLLLDAFTVLKGDCSEVLSWAFELKLLSQVGYCPCLEECVFCDQPVKGDKVFFLPEQGGVVCNNCKTAEVPAILISLGSLESLKALMRWETRMLHQIRIGMSAGREIQAMIRAFTEYHLEKKMKSCNFIDLLK
ncbi:MAG: DNA repair protein RecO [Peptococcaceae bacterium]|nr:DNA repair protein RecO [Peptococcaceae bacterium]